MRLRLPFRVFIGLQQTEGSSRISRTCIPTRRLASILTFRTLLCRRSSFSSDQRLPTNRRRQTNHSESLCECCTFALYTNILRRWVSTLSVPDLQRARSCTDFSQWAERGGNFRARSEQEPCAQYCNDGLSLYGTRIPAFAHTVRQTALILLPNRSPAGIPGHWPPSAHRGAAYSQALPYAHLCAQHGCC